MNRVVFAAVLALVAAEIEIEYIPSMKTPPSKRIFPIVSYSEPEDSLIIFSGFSGKSEENELWKFSINNQTWESCSPLESSYPGNI